MPPPTELAALPPRLLHFRVSHYSEKVRWGLDFKRIPHRRRAVVPGLHILRIRWLTGQNKVPVLELDGRAMFGSAAILAELERLHPTPRLFPGDEAERTRALALQAYFDDEVAPQIRRLLWSCYITRPTACARVATDGFGGGTRMLWRAMFPVLRIGFSRNMGLDAGSIEHARAALASHLDRLEAEIGRSGYLVGERFGIADLTAASIMGGIIRPPEFSYPLPEPQSPELIALREGIARHGAYRWVREILSRPPRQLGGGRRPLSGGSWRSGDVAVQAVRASNA